MLSSIRIGHGYDVHAFETGEYIVLGGVKIPHHSQFIAHSDGDVLLHAVCDALLGALSEGDIGRHFPDTDDAYKGIDSRNLLQQVQQIVVLKGFVTANIDVTVIAQSPRLSSHILQMEQNLAEDLCVDISQINVKATTTEKLGFSGREEGIEVHAVCILQKIA
ncbi:2-C-methyl-D-erythritol 2,4-cyclodiphosphate synthase [hydrothermal vent metagenome]|uniref:2-C-methyl-D-erythritol 2,4-cyclodiphosphate synthase n=1 Tax=hydrothermal vent metagenome TaxID=652676 RepID=A0A3B0XK68_9ZZZZ